jgi:hypothetical protein
MREFTLKLVTISILLPYGKYNFFFNNLSREPNEAPVIVAETLLSLDNLPMALRMSLKSLLELNL